MMQGALGHHFDWDYAPAALERRVSWDGGRLSPPPRPSLARQVAERLKPQMEEILTDEGIRTVRAHTDPADDRIARFFDTRESVDFFSVDAEGILAHQLGGDRARDAMRGMRSLPKPGTAIYDFLDRRLVGGLPQPSDESPEANVKVAIAQVFMAQALGGRRKKC